MKLSKSMIATISFCVLVGTLLMHSTQKVECLSDKNAIFTDDNLRIGLVKLFRRDPSDSCDSSLSAAQHDGENNATKNLKISDEVVNDIFVHVEQLVSEFGDMLNWTKQIVALLDEIIQELDNKSSEKPISCTMVKILEKITEFKDHNDAKRFKLEDVRSVVAEIQSKVKNLRKVVAKDDNISLLDKIRTTAKLLFGRDVSKKFSDTEQYFQTITSLMNELLNEVNLKINLLHITDLINNPFHLAISKKSKHLVRTFKLLNDEKENMREISTKFNKLMSNLKVTINSLSNKQLKIVNNAKEEKY